MKSKMKKIVAIVLASTMLIGMSLTANAAPNYVVGVSTRECLKCHHNSAVLRKIVPQGKKTVYYWNCVYCYYSFTSAVVLP